MKSDLVTKINVFAKGKKQAIVKLINILMI